MSDHYYETITEEIAREVHRLRREYPELGHEGIERLLEEAGFQFDEFELREYMDHHHMDPGPTAVWKTRLVGRRHFGGWI